VGVEGREFRVMGMVMQQPCPLLSVILKEGRPQQRVKEGHCLHSGCLLEEQKGKNDYATIPYRHSRAIKKSQQTLEWHGKGKKKCKDNLLR
jgi:hypothetical protein